MTAVYKAPQLDAVSGMSSLPKGTVDLVLSCYTNLLISKVLEGNVVNVLELFTLRLYDTPQYQGIVKTYTTQSYVLELAESLELEPWVVSHVLNLWRLVILQELHTTKVVNLYRLGTLRLTQAGVEVSSSRQFAQHGNRVVASMYRYFRNRLQDQG